jgi:hypothetical protein
MKKMLMVGMVRRGLMMTQHQNLAHPSLVTLTITTPFLEMTQEMMFPIDLQIVRKMQDEAAETLKKNPNLMTDLLPETLK